MWKMGLTKSDIRSQWCLHHLCLLWLFLLFLGCGISVYWYLLHERLTLHEHMKLATAE